MRAKQRYICLLWLMFTVIAYSQAALSAQATLTQETTPILGVWRAQMDGLPAVTLTITNEGGRLAGAVLFYLLRRDEKGTASSSPGIPEPLLNPTFDGKVLTFQISHRRAHPPRTLTDPPANFRLTLTGTNKGEFVNKDEDSPAIQLVRSDY
ncbi:MAG: hypothetical protein WA869_13595 [Alloacidobacterium sp.]|jgi:hypothetical protein